MVYYIRFLKTPRLQKQKTGSTSASALICITTDLGDAFLAQDLDLLVTLHLAQHENKIIYQERLQWQGIKRELTISLGPLPPQLSQQLMTMKVTASKDPTSSDPLLDQSSVPLVIGGRSVTFGGSRSLVADKLIERSFRVNQSVELSIWEETGNSIARHIW